MKGGDAYRHTKLEKLIGGIYMVINDTYLEPLFEAIYEAMALIENENCGTQNVA